jgi:anti-sigma factor ChrR (cupin superfamily)
MAQIDPKTVRLQAAITFEQFLNPKHQKAVVSNKNFALGNWNDLCRLQGSPKGVRKRVLPVDFRDFCMVVVTDVEPGTDVASHGHDEGIVRYIIEGSLRLNGVTYDAGDWILVPPGMKYEIHTDTGYKAVAGYLAACDPPT